MTEHLKTKLVLLYIGNHYYEDILRTLRDLEQIKGIIDNIISESKLQLNDRMQNITKNIEEVFQYSADILESYKSIIETSNELAEGEKYRFIDFDLAGNFGIEMNYTNVYINELNTYFLGIYDLFNTSDDVKRTAMIAGLEEKTIILYRLVAERQEGINNMLKQLRKCMVQISLHEVQANVASRNEQLRNYKPIKEEENVEDYADLEGQYRNKFDEDGNVIPTEEIQGENSSTLIYVAIALLLLVVAVVAYKFIM